MIDARIIPDPVGNKRPLAESFASVDSVCVTPAFPPKATEEPTWRRFGYSITSSARSSSDDGTLRSSVLAAFRLMSSWNLLG